MRVGPWEAPREESHVGAAGGGAGVALVGVEEESAECRGEEEPDMYNSRKARLCSGNFHSFKNPRVPIEKERIGGTLEEWEKRDEACSIVPSPPKVVVRSTLLESRWLEAVVLSVFRVEDVYIGKGRSV